MPKANAGEIEPKVSEIQREADTDLPCSPVTEIAPSRVRVHNDIIHMVAPHQIWGVRIEIVFLAVG